MIKLMDLLKENSNSSYDFGCAMIYFNFPKLFKIQDVINPKDIYTEEGDKTYGLEDEPHCTLLYGLHKEVELPDVKDALKGIKFNDCRAYNVSVFKNEKYDVLKFDVGYLFEKDNFLHNANTKLKEYPFTSNFPDYHPHLTIGYLQSGKGDKYVKAFKGLEYKLTPEYGMFSQADGTKSKFKI